MVFGALSSFVTATALSTFIPEGGQMPAHNKQFQMFEPCEKPGFYADPKNCDIFYCCAEHESKTGAPVLHKFMFHCPVGTAFDESLQVCNYPQNVRSLPANCLTSVEIIKTQTQATLEEVTPNVPPTTPQYPLDHPNHQQQPITNHPFFYVKF